MSAGRTRATPHRTQCADVRPAGMAAAAAALDREAACTWVYPTDLPVREYQYNIVARALLTNVMVVLPTGLGKTFIAAVVMYNFYRWFPRGKVIFLAPTRPLVAQQMEACFRVVRIAPADTVIMTGSRTPTLRAEEWLRKRVFFLTPQVVQNDLNRGTCPWQDIVCLVIDEAHRAQGGHAYVTVVRQLLQHTHQFRVLALTATPGNDVVAIRQVIQNLLVSHVELRTEESLDVHKYVRHRKMTVCEVRDDRLLERAKQCFSAVAQPVLQRLCGNGVFYQPSLAVAGQSALLMARDRFRQSPPVHLHQRMAVILADFAVALSYVHAYHTLESYGAHAFYQYIKHLFALDCGIPLARTELVSSPDFMAFMQELDTKYAGAAAIPLEGNPKLLQLRACVREHFSTASAPADTRVMVFSQLRDSVQEIVSALAGEAPLVRPVAFIGQSGGYDGALRGLTQREQMEIVRKFRSGDYNTLVATCIGEEGLDIGSVDLTVCFDAQPSAIRLIQRMGRTGRVRDGHIVVLVAAGREHQVYKSSQGKKRSILQTMTKPTANLQLYDAAPRMIPQDLHPKCVMRPMAADADGGRPQPELPAAKLGKRTVRDVTAADARSTPTPQRTVMRVQPSGFLLPADETAILRDYDAQCTALSAALADCRTDKYAGNAAHRITHSYDAHVLLHAVGAMEDLREAAGAAGSAARVADLYGFEMSLVLQEFTVSVDARADQPPLPWAKRCKSSPADRGHAQAAACAPPGTAQPTKSVYRFIDDSESDGETGGIGRADTRSCLTEPGACASSADQPPRQSGLSPQPVQPPQPALESTGSAVAGAPSRSAGEATAPSPLHRLPSITSPPPPLPFLTKHPAPSAPAAWEQRASQLDWSSQASSGAATQAILAVPEKPANGTASAADDTQSADDSVDAIILLAAMESSSVNLAAASAQQQQPREQPPLARTAAVVIGESSTEQEPKLQLPQQQPVPVMQPAQPQSPPQPGVAPCGSEQRERCAPAPLSAPSSATLAAGGNVRALRDDSPLTLPRRKLRRVIPSQEGAGPVRVAGVVDLTSEDEGRADGTDYRLVPANGAAVACADRPAGAGEVATCLHERNGTVPTASANPEDLRGADGDDESSSTGDDAGIWLEASLIADRVQKAALSRDDPLPRTLLNGNTHAVEQTRRHRRQARDARRSAYISDEADDDDASRDDGGSTSSESEEEEEDRYGGGSQRSFIDDRSTQEYDDPHAEAGMQAVYARSLISPHGGGMFRSPGLRLRPRGLVPRTPSSACSASSCQPSSSVGHSESGARSASVASVSASPDIEAPSHHAAAEGPAQPASPSPNAASVRPAAALGRPVKDARNDRPAGLVRELFPAVPDAAPAGPSAARPPDRRAIDLSHEPLSVVRPIGSPGPLQPAVAAMDVTSCQPAPPTAPHTHADSTAAAGTAAAAPGALTVVVDGRQVALTQVRCVLAARRGRSVVAAEGARADLLDTAPSACSDDGRRTPWRR